MVSIIPDGLYDFLQRKGHTLLIKGDAGTGKTTLALEILRTYGEEAKGVYLSTRVSPSELYSQFGWLKEIVKPEHLISATYAPDETRFDDVRLADTQYILGRTLDAIESLQTPVIVFDTWDGIAREMNEKERLRAEKSLITILSSSDAKGIFVSEEPTRTTIDYLVDGIITLSQSELDGRTIREIELNKLRGIRISPKKFVFTLDDGRFRYFNPYERKTIEKNAKWEFIPDSKDYFSTGSKDLDTVLGGGYPRGSYAILEAESNVPQSAIWLMECSLIRNSLSQDRGVTVVPTGGDSSRDYQEHLAPYIGQDKIDNFLRIFEVERVAKEQDTPFVVNVEEKPVLEKDYMLWIETAEELGKRTGQAVLNIAGLDILESRYSEEAEELFRIVNEQAIRCKASETLGLAIARSNLTITPRVFNMAEIHLRMVERNGSVILYGVKPRTPLYVLERDVDRGYPIARLTPVV